MAVEDTMIVVNDPKKSGGPLCCTLICGSVLGILFLEFWINNPDQKPADFNVQTQFFPNIHEYKFNCYAYTGKEDYNSNNVDDINYGDANWGIIAYLDDVPMHATNPNMALLQLNN
jgi:hypothetical protein